jgi:hypothetical protein
MMAVQDGTPIDAKGQLALTFFSSAQTSLRKAFSAASPIDRIVALQAVERALRAIRRLGFTARTFNQMAARADRNGRLAPAPQRRMDATSSREDFGVAAEALAMINPRASADVTRLAVRGAAAQKRPFAMAM